ncbi:hypothetical protein, variant 1 [Aphanomyces invadans]|uniref:Rab3-GAP regulatory subunit N-terminal domain-containing protein n=1 Tax=Aphanomyces invadans TaxID=157072 RepID=A0A024U8B1_9STRA|nr:hypothetical protein, variant 1 [Aphanomyces invadans]ETW01828.1 hypothetical protein, variant 1 [Aphanomyces invadans]|eukprot:XP_008869676.1 hypothetical protein, variant 1 [Aphanomyces invadans]
MRELGTYRYAVSAIFDVAPDLWACAYEESTKKQWLLAPSGRDEVQLQPAVQTDTLAERQDSDISTIRPTAGRFHTALTAENTYDVALGYSNGDVCVYNRSGGVLFALQCHHGAVARLEWNFHSAKPNTRELYVLFVDMTLVVIEWELVDSMAPKRYWRKYSLNGQRDIIGMLPCAVTRPASLFQSQPRAGLQTFMAVGCDPVVGFYHAGTFSTFHRLLYPLPGHEGTSLFRIAHLASAVATRAAGAVWSLAKNWGWPQDKVNDTVDAVPSDLGIHVALGMPDSHRRRARDLNVSPNGKLALVPDTLGRIFLIDTTSMLVIRLWKGYRDAQCGWMTHNDGLYMVFYSARRGLVEVWRARHGPRVLCLPLGAHAKLKLCTCLPQGPDDVVKCVFVWEQSSGESAVYQVELDANSITTEVQYKSRAKGEHESYIVHQLIDGIEKCLTKPSLTATVLDQMKSLKTIEGVESVVETLHEQKMGALHASFHRDTLTILLEVARQGREWGETQANFADLLFLFNLEWKLRLAQGFVDLEQEVTTKPFSPALFDDEDEVFTRMTKWRSIYGFQATAKQPTPLNCLQFIDCFAAPWADAVNPELELSLAHILHKTQRKDLAFDECVAQLYAVFKSPILRPPRSPSTHASFVSFLFAPLHGAVFSVQHVQAIHRRLLLDQDTEQYTHLFLEWYFALTEDEVLGMTSTNASSCLQRWLQPWLQSCSFPHSIDETSFTLPALSTNLCVIFDQCRSTPLLLHAFVLCHHVAHGLTHHANAVQDSTLGQVSAVGAGLRWRVLQQCLSQCLYFTCLLKVPGKLHVNAIESLDELMKFVAIVHLNTPKDSTDAPVIPYDIEDAWIAAWTASTKSHAVMSILSSFHQLDHPDSLSAFRTLMLCTAWNNDRSRMSFLALALQELDHLDGDDALKQAILVLMWDSYIRAQIKSILDYWIQVSTGKRSNKALDPIIAREFLVLVHQLLDVLSDTIKRPVLEVSKSRTMLSQHDHDGNCVATTVFNSDDPLDVGQLLTPVVWTGTPNDVLNMYRTHWPSSPIHSSLMKQLAHPTSTPTQASVDTHRQVVSVLIAFTSYSETIVPLPSLFDVSSLCKVPSFNEDAGTPSTAHGEARFQFTMALLRYDIAMGMAVAASLHLPLDQIKQDHAVWLYQAGKDALAEEVLDKVLIDPAVVTRMGRVARSRLALILSRMQSRSEYAVLMSQLPADSCAWIRSSEAPLGPDPHVALLDTAPSLAATNALLHQCVQWMPPASSEHKKSLAMIAVVQLLLSQLKSSDGVVPTSRRKE